MKKINQTSYSLETVVIFTTDALIEMLTNGHLYTDETLLFVRRVLNSRG